MTRMPHSCSSESLRNSEVYVSTMQPKHRRCAVEEHSSRTTLRNQNLRRVQQETVIHRQCATERSLKTESQTDGVGPVRPQVLFVNRRDNISRRDHRRVFLSEQFANTAEDIA